MDSTNAPAGSGQVPCYQQPVSGGSSHGSFNDSNVSHVLVTEEQLHLSDDNGDDSQQPLPLGQHSSAVHTSAVPYLKAVLGKAAVTASSNNADPATVQRARLKIHTLLQTIAGITSGFLMPGSRTPIARTPVWLTPVVISGGFPSGQLAAGGMLTDYETKLAHQLEIPLSDDPADIRLKLNRIWFNEPYYSQLCDMLDNGTYRFNFPEEAVMLVAVALQRSGYGKKAEKLIRTVAPFMKRARFFPEPAQKLLPLARTVSMTTVPDALVKLHNRFSPHPEHKTNTRRHIEKNALVFDQWLPLKDRLLKLVLDTVVGEPPYYSFTGELCGGMPLVAITPKWAEEARQFQADRKQVLEQYPEMQYRSMRKRGSERILLRSLEIALANPPQNQLPANRVGFLKIQENLRKTLADVHHKQGAPGSEKQQKIQDNRQLWLEKHKNAASKGQLLIAQLHPFKDDNQLPPGNLSVDMASMPASVKKLLEKLQPRELAELLTRHDITSSEVLAAKLLEIVPIVKSESMADPTLATLFAYIGQAFNRRRSLLLHSLQSQVRINELPWVKHLEAITPVDKASRQENVRALITDAVLQVLTYFPYTIFPNPFIKSLTQLVRALPEARMKKIALTNELAADIYEGAFSKKYVTSAKEAAKLMTGTLYERYYGLEYDKISRFRKQGHLYNLCHSLSGVPKKTHRFHYYAPRENGKIIEWQQIITTHNLASLTNFLGLHEYLQSDNGAKSSHKIAEWIIDKHSRYNPDNPDWIRLREHKNIAYAFRQMLFFLSFQTNDVQLSVLAKLKTIPEIIEGKMAAISSTRKRTAAAPESTTANEASTSTKKIDRTLSLVGSRERLERLTNQKKEAHLMVSSLEAALLNQGTQTNLKPFMGWL